MIEDKVGGWVTRATAESLVMNQELDERINRNYTYHAPKRDQVERYQAIGDSARSLAELIIGASPVSREQSLALTNVEQAVMWANAAIARNE